MMILAFILPIETVSIEHEYGHRRFKLYESVITSF